jgi:hypothetical protein
LRSQFPVVVLTTHWASMQKRDALVWTQSWDPPEPSGVKREGGMKAGKGCTTTRLSPLEEPWDGSFTRSCVGPSSW